MDIGCVSGEVHENLRPLPWLRNHLECSADFLRPSDDIAQAMAVKTLALGIKPNAVILDDQPQPCAVFLE